MDQSIRQNYPLFFLIHSSLESVLCLIRYGTESAGKEKKKKRVGFLYLDKLQIIKADGD